MALRYPCSKDSISQNFGEDSRKHRELLGFYSLFDDKHPGVDFALPIGTKINAAMAGIAVRSEFHKGMGNVVGIRNGNIICLYAHLSKISVKLGNIIKAGSLVGLSGNTGSATTEPHLHFEIRDITKKELKDMVFDPPFGKQVKQFKKDFKYKINNQNTKKSLGFLAIRYFGQRKYWKKIFLNNSKLENNPDAIIPDKTTIIVPNYY